MLKAQRRKAELVVGFKCNRKLVRVGGCLLYEFQGWETRSQCNYRTCPRPHNKAVAESTWQLPQLEPDARASFC